MNEKKFCFIACVNNERYAEEMKWYINRLNVPEGYEVEIRQVRGAKSMCAGYNLAMKESDAKYKIYLHQDVFVTNRDFLVRLLELFADETIGMIGMVGAPVMPENGIMWETPRVGMIYSTSVYVSGIGLAGENDRLCEVEAVDGLLMATQADIPWREEVFEGWDFYDTSQGREMRKAGYRVVVPALEEPWVVHDDGFMNLKNYYVNRKKYLDLCRAEKFR